MKQDKRRLDQLTSDDRFLFDCGVRTRREAKDFDESDFCFLNRLAWEGVTEARDTLELWFSRFPSKKRADIRSRFRSGDREHHGALLELATHEILYAVGTDVRVDPCIDGITPDFSTRFKREEVLVECTVVQESDEQFKREQNENALKQIADTIDSGPFRLDWQLHRAGCNMPNTSSFQCKLKEWIASLNPPEVFKRIEEGDFDYGSLFWCQDGWNVQLSPMRGPPAHLRRPGLGAIGGQSKSGSVDDDIQLRKALQSKADRYRHLDAPLLVVAGSSKWPTYSGVVLHALFGSRALRYSGSEIEFEETCPFSTSENSFGSPNKPRKRHVSAVLHKSFAHHTSIWGLCDPDTQWTLIHNPWATQPLPRGLFPFAHEWILKQGKFVVTGPTCSINRLLGISDPWPGKER